MDKCFKILLLFLCISIYSTVLCQNPHLISDVSWVAENYSLTLTCVLPSAVIPVAWIKNGVSTGMRIGLLSGRCVSDPSPLPQRFSFTCVNATVYTLTILQMNRTLNGDNWQCSINNVGLPIYSETVTLTVKVPITDVSFSNPSAENSVDVVENGIRTFTCHTSGGIPAANVTWYKISGSSATAITTGEMSFHNTSADTTVIVTSTLTYTAMRVDHGCKIFCRASNVVGQVKTSTREILLNILFAPMKSASIEIYNNISSPVFVNVTLAFHAEAYPVPKYTWQKCLITCTDVYPGFKYNIYTNALVTNLTINSVDICDFGSYRVVVSNGVGTAWIEKYNLIHQAKPETPKYFHCAIKAATSVECYWLTGYNVGLPQTFVIEYRKIDSTTWNNVSVVEEISTSFVLMNVTVDSLSPTTEYQARMYAKNTIAVSQVTDTITFTLEDRIATVTQKSMPQIGPIVGGVVPGILLVIVLVGLIYLRLTYHIDFKKKGKQSDTAVYEDVSRRNETTNRVYEGCSSTSLSPGEYSSLQDQLPRDDNFPQSGALGTNTIELQEESAYQNERLA
ncbi:uncharacterized protein LOC127838356 [Dreissena polymorpha]|uniref:uncharacterized protein LOC127838356 n=1 Tax=Dreissena polymorpha TaxID=45954 RepID=UPI0022656460|nr:uncharacterized protein LOC127838356 [Dreissena polymorpha]